MTGDPARRLEETASEVVLVWDSRCTVGESPVWDAARGKLWFCDIYERHLLCFDPARGDHAVHTLPDRVCSFCLCRSGKLLVALRKRLVLWDPATGALADFAGPVAEPEALRLNDGKLGPDGAFWVGSMVEHAPRGPEGSLWRVTPDGRVERRAEGITISNGLAWSPDGRTMFHSDTGAAPAFIDAWAFDPSTGALGARRRLATFDGADDLPDGGAALADGSYLSASNGAGRVRRFSMTGELLDEIVIPVPRPTMPCVAGRDLYVTSLRQGLSEAEHVRYPGSGGLFRTRAPAPGVPIGLFDA